MKLTLMLMVILAAGLVSLGSAGRRSMTARERASKEITTLSMRCYTFSGWTVRKGESIQIDLYLNNPDRERQLLCSSKCKLQVGKYLQCRDHIVTVDNITVKETSANIVFLIPVARYGFEAPVYHTYSDYLVVFRKQKDGKPTTSEGKCTVYQRILK